MYFPWQQSIRIIARPKLALPGEHWGVQLPGGEVIHLALGGLRIDTLEIFLAGKKLREVRAAKPNRHGEILHRVNQALAFPPAYRLADQNCEVFANWLLGDPPESPQVRGAVVLALFAALILASG